MLTKEERERIVRQVEDVARYVGVLGKSHVSPMFNGVNSLLAEIDRLQAELAELKGER